MSFLKAAAFEDGHAGYSDPLDEQHFLVRVINALQKSPEWSETAVIILYDDSDGWYDHQMPPIVNPSFNPAVDTLNGPGVCKTSNGFQQDEPVLTTPLKGNSGKPAWGRCGYGTRMPLLVVSPFAKRNHVDHTLTDQTSVLRFIEDNWLDGKRIQPGGSFDTIAGPLNNMFDFDDRDERGPRKVLLDEKTGVVVSVLGLQRRRRRSSSALERPPAAVRVRSVRARGAVHRFPQIAAPLHVQPEIGAVAEHAGEDERGRRRHVPAVVAQLVDVLALHAHRLGQRALGQPQRLHELLDQNLADRGRLALRRQHGSPRFTCSCGRRDRRPLPRPGRRPIGRPAAIAC